MIGFRKGIIGRAEPPGSMSGTRWECDVVLANISRLHGNSASVWNFVNKTVSHVKMLNK